MITSTDTSPVILGGATFTLRGTNPEVPPGNQLHNIKK